MRKRHYTALPCATLVPTDEDTPMPVIHNIVSTAHIMASQMPLDLLKIREILPGSAYDRKKFAAMTIRIANPNCTLLLFSSGKMVVTGCQTWYEGVLSCLSLTRILQSRLSGVDFNMKSCDIQNIVAHVEIPVNGGFLDIDSMYSKLGLHCTYQKTMFPGLIYRPQASPVVLLCFYSGKIVITGGKNTRDVYEGWSRQGPVIRVFIRSGPPAGQEPKPAVSVAPGLHVTSKKRRT